MDWQWKLISLYLFICNEYKNHLWPYCERMTNYADLSFSDEEVLTIFLYGVINKRRELKEIYQEAERYLKSWFPKLPGYVAFVQRINRVCDVFVPLIDSLQSQLPADVYVKTHQLIDSMPIVMAQQGRRFKAKVAAEIATSNGYCATKKMHYYGVKLHVLGCYRKGTLPIPSYIGLTNAGMGDRKAYELILPQLSENVFADKAYQIENKPIVQNGPVVLHTPVKKQKGQTLLDSADKLLSSAISSIRQPIESFFNWLEEKTSIQMASKVRSYQGLMVHVFGRIAAAFFILIDRVISS
jgi:hypothetical protein